MENEEQISAETITDLAQIEQALEATIFASPKAMTMLRLKNLLGHFNYATENLKEILDALIEKSAQKGFQLVKVAGGYQYRSHPEHAQILQRLLEDKPARLSGSALEVLAIVAYKQPLTRSEIDSVRGVDSGHLMRGLLEKNLVRTAGHAETPGRPLLYATTSCFLEVFSMGSLDELPAMEELGRELSAEGSADGAGDSLLLAPEPGFSLDSSSLAANPDRGAFDAMKEDVVDLPDFGENERAMEP